MAQNSVPNLMLEFRMLRVISKASFPSVRFRRFRRIASSISSSRNCSCLARSTIRFSDYEPSPTRGSARFSAIFRLVAQPPVHGPSRMASVQWVSVLLYDPLEALQVGSRPSSLNLRLSFLPRH